MAHLKSNGFVKLDRGILDWEWYEDTYTARLFFHCLLKANWKPGVWKGQPYKRGQFITSLPSQRIRVFGAKHQNRFATFDPNR